MVQAQVSSVSPSTSVAGAAEAGAPGSAAPSAEFADAAAAAGSVDASAAASTAAVLPDFGSALFLARAEAGVEAAGGGGGAGGRTCPAAVSFATRGVFGAERDEAKWVREKKSKMGKVQGERTGRGGERVVDQISFKIKKSTTMALVYPLIKVSSDYVLT